MQNVFQVDASLLGASAGGAVKIKGTTQTPLSATPHNVDANGADEKGQNGVIFGFQTVFEDMQSATTDTPDAILDETDAPADPMAMLDNVLRAFQSGEIVLDDLFDGVTDLAEQAKALLSDLTDRLGTAGIGDLNRRDLFGLVQDIVQASPEAFNALSGQVIAPTADAYRLATPSVAPPVSRPVSPSANGRGPDQMPGQIPTADGATGMSSLAPNGRLQDGATADATAPGPQIADPQITGTGDPSQMQRPSETAANGKQPSAPTTRISTAGETPLTALARDLDQTPKSLKAELEEARIVATQDRIIDLPRDGIVARTTPQTSGQVMPPLAVTTVAAQSDPAMTGQAATGGGMDFSGMDGADLAARDGRSVAPVGTLGTPSLLSPSLMSPAQAQQVTRQIAYAIQTTQGRAVEITLNPAELGHVRISLSSAETGMVVAIQADRPETLELMRRHADLLANDFRDIGYDGTSFSFEQSGGEGANPDQDTPGSSQDTVTNGRTLSVTADLSDTTPPPTALRVGDGGIDIRL